MGRKSDHKKLSMLEVIFHSISAQKSVIGAEIQWKQNSNSEVLWPPLFHYLSHVKVELG